jgi:hypothetical protein
MAVVNSHQLWAIVMLNVLEHSQRISASGGEAREMKKELHKAGI